MLRRRNLTRAGLATTTTTVVGALALVLTACTGGAASPSPADPSVTVTDAWVKAAESGMTGAFAILTNEGTAEVTVVAATSAAAARVELHESVPGDTGGTTMREVSGGLAVPAGGTLTLEPGGNHLMLMDLAAPLVAGEQVTVTLTFADDTTLDVHALVKDYAGANETYDGVAAGDAEH